MPHRERVEGIPRKTTCTGIMLGGVVLALLASCSFSEEFADQAIDYNKTVEVTANRQMLLNALRARDRMPLYFSSISKLTGNVSLAVSAGLGSEIGLTPIGGTLAPSTGVTQESSPFFDVAPQYSREFIAGMLKPIRMRLIDFFWQQGWQQELLLHLFIEKVQFSPPIRFCDEIEPVTVIRNNPANEKDAERFRKLISVFRYFYGIDTTVGELHQVIGPPIPADAASGYKPTIAADGYPLAVIAAGAANVNRDGLVFSTLGAYAHRDPAMRELIETGKGHGRLRGLNLPGIEKENPESLFLLANRRQVHWFHFAEETIGCTGVGEKVLFEIDDRGGDPADGWRPAGREVVHELPAASVGSHPHYAVRAKRTGAPSDAEVEELRFQIYTRGTMGIFYFLGEILRRVHVEGRPPLRIDLGPPDLYREDDEILFTMVKLSDGADNDFRLTVEYHDGTYGIPHLPTEQPNPAGQTTAVLALLNQLLALSQTSEDLPQTTTTVVTQ